MSFLTRVFSTAKRRQPVDDLSEQVHRDIGLRKLADYRRCHPEEWTQYCDVISQQTNRTTFLGAFVDIICSIIVSIRRYLRYRASLRILQSLDDRTLNDIGLQPVDFRAIAESFANEDPSLMPDSGKLRE